MKRRSFLAVCFSSLFLPSIPSPKSRMVTVTIGGPGTCRNSGYSTIAQWEADLDNPELYDRNSEAVATVL